MRISDTNIDFEEIKQQINEWLTANSEFSGIQQSKTMQVLVNLVAGVGSYIAYKIHASNLNAYLPTAFAKDGIWALALSSGGQPPHRKRAAKVECSIVGSLERPIPAFSKWSRTLGGQQRYFYNRLPIVTREGFKETPITLHQGETKKESFSGGDQNYYKFLIGEDFDVDEPLSGTLDEETGLGDSIRVFVGGLSLENRWERLIGSFISLSTVETGTDGHNRWIARTEPDGRVSINFGNGVFGNTPGDGEVWYATTLGAAGNSAIVGDSIELVGDIEGNVLGNVSATVTGAATGGVDEESIEQIKLSSPRLLAANRRAVRRDDYVAHLLEYPETKFASVWGEYEEAAERGEAFNRDNMNVVHISATKDSIANMEHDITDTLLDSRVTANTVDGGSGPFGIIESRSELTNDTVADSYRELKTGAGDIDGVRVVNGSLQVVLDTRFNVRYQRASGPPSAPTFGGPYGTWQESIPGGSGNVYCSLCHVNDRGEDIAWPVQSASYVGTGNTGTKKVVRLTEGTGVTRTSEGDANLSAYPLFKRLSMKKFLRDSDGRQLHSAGDLSGVPFLASVSSLNFGSRVGGISLTLASGLNPARGIFTFKDPEKLEDVRYVNLNRNGSVLTGDIPEDASANWMDSISLISEAQSEVGITRVSEIWNDVGDVESGFLLGAPEGERKLSVTFKSETLSRATATAEMEINNITVTNGGSGYTSAPTMTISSPPSTATATAIIASGRVTGFTITNRGSGYTSAPTVAITGGSGAVVTAVLGTGSSDADKVVSITVTNGGTGYTSASRVTITDSPSGTTSTATATVGTESSDATTYRKVTAITVTNHGSGYISVPTVEFTGNGSGATVEVDLRVRRFMNLAGGSGYTNAPAVTISAPPSGTDRATATATIDSNGEVTALTVTNDGSAYTSVPTVTIEGSTLLDDVILEAEVGSEGNFREYSGDFREIWYDDINSEIGIRANVLPSDPVSLNIYKQRYYADVGDSIEGAISLPWGESFTTYNDSGVEERRWRFTTPPDNPFSDVETSDVFFGVLVEAWTKPVIVNQEEVRNVTRISGESYARAGRLVAEDRDARNYLASTFSGEFKRLSDSQIRDGFTTLELDSDEVGGEMRFKALNTEPASYPKRVDVWEKIPSQETTATATATIGTDSNDSATYQKITGFTITERGSGYATAPAVTLSGGEATTVATNPTATIDSNGVVTGISVATDGSGYTSAPTVTISGHTALTFSTFDAPTNNTVRVRIGDTAHNLMTTSLGSDTYQLTNSNLITGGFYSDGFSLTLRNDPGSEDVYLEVLRRGRQVLTYYGLGRYGQWISSITPTDADVKVLLDFGETVKFQEIQRINSGEANYFDYAYGRVSGPVKRLSEGQTVDAISMSLDASRVLFGDSAFSEGSLTGIDLRSGGSGYMSAPTVAIDPPTGGRRATATAVMSGYVNSISVSYRGYTYTSLTQAAVTISGGGGNGATAVASGMCIWYIPIANGGSGYADGTDLGIVTITRAAGDTTGSGATATATVIGGVVKAISVRGNSGHGYTEQPAVTIDSPPSTARATATIDGSGAVDGITVDAGKGGSGYVTAPDVTIASPPPSTATATATITGGVVRSVTVTNRGYGYTSAPTVTITGGSGAVVTAVLGTGSDSDKVVSITVTSGGTGYTSASRVTITDSPSGITATATATVSGNEVTAITVTNGGSGYTDVPKVTIADSPSGTTAMVDSSQIQMCITDFDVTNEGSGYTSSPSVEVKGPLGFPGGAARATASIRNRVSGIEVLDGSSGYTIPPAVTISGGGGSGATATAEIDSNGAVTGFTNIVGGDDYMGVPDVTIADVGTTSVTATATAFVGSDRSLSRIVLDNKGSGYTRLPNVTITGGGGRGARAIPTTVTKRKLAVSDMLGVKVKYVGNDFKASDVSAIDDYMDSLKSFTSELEFRYPFAIVVDIVADVYHTPLSDTNQLYINIDRAARDFFRDNLFSLGRLLAVSDVYNLIKAVPGVSYCNVVSPSNDVPALKNQFVVLRDVNITFHTSER